MIEYDITPPETEEDNNASRSPYEGCVDCFDVFDRMLDSMYGGMKYGNDY